VTDILAAGGIVWRTVDGERRIGVVERDRRQDVSLPKGKLEAGETLAACAVREVAEELGARVTLGAFLGAVSYPVGPRDKYVLFWDMEWAGDADDGPDGFEISGRRWLAPDDALAELSYELERDVVRAAISRRRS
jgi:8-oxo-dGTP diphosphatase